MIIATDISTCTKERKHNYSVEHYLLGIVNSSDKNKDIVFYF